ncbi:MAG: DUF4249 domain-containing protein [Bacteroidales bacterium]|nr:MAG: DUF4249 domain-containing protein [Bacteroidales bacterium]
MRKKLLFISIIIFFIPGCTEMIDVDLDESSVKLVVDGYITNRYANHTIQLTRTGPYFSNVPPERVSDAVVTVHDSIHTYTFSELLPGVYFSDEAFAGITGRIYNLSIELEGEFYSASSIMPQVPVIDSIQFHLNSEDEEKFDIALFAREPPTPGDHYFWAVYKEYILVTDKIIQLVFANDDLINGNYFNGILVQYVKGRLGNLITLEMASITEEYYEFCLAVIKETVYVDVPFESAPAVINGNIDNGALGFFTAYAVASKTRQIKLTE